MVVHMTKQAGKQLLGDFELFAWIGCVKKKEEKVFFRIKLPHLCIFTITPNAPFKYLFARIKYVCNFHVGYQVCEMT